MHFVDIEQDATVTDNKMRQVMRVMNGHIIPYIAGDDDAVGNSDGHFEVVMLNDHIAQTSDSHQPEKPGVLYLVGIKRIRNQDLIPVVCRIVIFHQLLHLIRPQVPPS